MLRKRIKCDRLALDLRAQNTQLRHDGLEGGDITVGGADKSPPDPAFLPLKLRLRRIPFQSATLNTEYNVPWEPRD